MIKGSVQWEDTTVVKIYYAANIGAPNYIKQILTADIKEKMDSNT